MKNQKEPMTLDKLSVGGSCVIEQVGNQRGASSVKGTSLPLRGNDRPGSLRLPGCLAALGTRVWRLGC